MAQSALAMIHLETGDYKTAEALQQKALQGDRLTSEKGEPSNALLLRRMATIKTAQGQYSEALKILEQALKAQQRGQAAGPQEPGQQQQAQQQEQSSEGGILRDLGRVHLLRGSYKAAAEMSRAAIERMEEGRSISARTVLARALLCSGQVPAAHELLRQVLESGTKQKGASVLDAAEARYWLGSILEQQGRLDEALAQHELALKEREKLADAFDRGSSLVAISRLLAAQKQADKAVQNLSDVLKLEVRQPYQRARLRADALTALAGARWELNRRKPGPNMSTVIEPLQEAARIYAGLGAYDRCAQAQQSFWLKKKRLDVLVQPPDDTGQEPAPGTGSEGCGDKAGGPEGCASP